jgi:hypothetical protein
MVTTLALACSAACAGTAHRDLVYGAPAHPMEAAGIGSSDNVKNVVIQALSAPGGTRLTGTVCLGPLKDRSAVRGVYLYSSRDRIADTAAAYPAAFPVGVLPTKENDTGLVVKTTSVDAWRADGTQMTRASLGGSCMRPLRLWAPMPQSGLRSE